jgi:hypothetical protein
MTWTIQISVWNIEPTVRNVEVTVSTIQVPLWPRQAIVSTVQDGVSTIEAAISSARNQCRARSRKAKTMRHLVVAGTLCGGDDQSPILALLRAFPT